LLALDGSFIDLLLPTFPFYMARIYGPNINKQWRPRDPENAAKNLHSLAAKAAV